MEEDSCVIADASSDTKEDDTNVSYCPKSD